MGREKNKQKSANKNICLFEENILNAFFQTASFCNLENVLLRLKSHAMKRNGNANFKQYRPNFCDKMPKFMDN